MEPFLPLEDVPSPCAAALARRTPPTLAAGEMRCTSLNPACSSIARACGDVREPKAGRVTTGVLRRPARDAEGVELYNGLVALIVACGRLHQQRAGTDKMNLLQRQQGWRKG
jgi:hypothetical protein